MAPSRAQKDDVVHMGGKTLKRVMDNETRQWVYRPVDESSGKVISKEAFEAMKREEAKARWESDPKRQAEQDKKWAAQQRSEIRGARIAESKQMKKQEHVRKLKSGLVEPSRPRRKEIANVPVPKVLADLREEMRVAVANGMDKRNPGQFAFIKTALDAEEVKHDHAVKAAKEKAYAKERKKRGVKGAAWGSSGGEDASDDDGGGNGIPRRDRSRTWTTRTTGEVPRLHPPQPPPPRTAQMGDPKGRRRNPPTGAARSAGGAERRWTGRRTTAANARPPATVPTPRPGAVPAPKTGGTAAGDDAGTSVDGVAGIGSTCATQLAGGGGAAGRGRGGGGGGGGGAGARVGAGAGVGAEAAAEGARGRGAPSQSLFDPDA